MVMSNSLQESRLAAIKAERKVKELVEREDYYSKLLKVRDDEIISLAERYAYLEKDHAQAQEKWRLADNERMQKYYNPMFG
jgi:hypothetical protein